MHQLSDDSSFHYEILRALGLTTYNGGDIGEILVTISKIIPGDFESYATQFSSLAYKVYERALSIPGKFPISAQSAFFAAAAYFRSADFYLHGNAADPRIMDLWGNQTAAFDLALSYLSTPYKRDVISTPDFDIPVIWYTPSHEEEQRPTIIMGGGYDGSQEELYHSHGVAALDRGYNVLTYEGPGQPSVRRDQDLGFIHDWERVVTPVLDFALSKTGSVDPDAIGLIGRSLGGYLAPRAAAFEHRLAAVFALDGVWDFGARVLTMLPQQLQDLYSSGDKAAFDELINEVVIKNGTTVYRWAVTHGLWSFKTDSAFEYLGLALKYSLKEVYDKIKTPVFIGDAENDIFFAGEPKRLADALGQWGYLHQFRADDGVGEHTAAGGARLQNQVIYEWFEETINAKKRKRGFGKH
jgi:hypothetical protein